MADSMSEDVKLLSGEPVEEVLDKTTDPIDDDVALLETDEEIPEEPQSDDEPELDPETVDEKPVDK